MRFPSPGPCPGCREGKQARPALAEADRAFDHVGRRGYDRFLVLTNPDQCDSPVDLVIAALPSAGVE